MDMMPVTEKAGLYDAIQLSLLLPADNGTCLKVFGKDNGMISPAAMGTWELIDKSNHEGTCIHIHLRGCGYVQGEESL